MPVRRSRASSLADAYASAPQSLTSQGASFEPHSPKAVYMWETWLHTHMRASQYLTKVGRNDDALDELAEIRDPSAPDAGWRFLPFQRIASGETLREVWAWLADPAGHPEAISAFKRQLRAWRADPFRTLRGRARR